MRRPRLDDVAADAGVSPATVSLVLRDIAGPSAATRRRVLASAARLKYRPDRAASALASRRSRLIGVVMDIGNSYQTQLVQDVYEAAQQLGYNVLLSTIALSHTETRAIETLVDSRCEGLILLGPQAPARQIADLGTQLPVVVVGRPVPSADVDVVRTDDRDGVGQAIAHLAGLGHRAITYIDGGHGTVETLRRRAYQSEMRRHHLTDHISVIPGGKTESDGSRAAGVIRQRKSRPTGVLTFNDRCAMGLIDTLVRAHVDIPDTISVVGYDDGPVARLEHINLTTVSQNTRKLAEHAMTALIDRLDNGRTDPHEVVVPAQLIVRGTTGRPLGRQQLASQPAWPTEAAAALYEVDPDMLVNIEHEDTELGRIEGLEVAAAVLREADAALGK